MFITTVTAIYSLGHGLCTLTAVPRSTQPSTFRGMVKWVSAYELSNNNKWRWCLRMVAADQRTHSPNRLVWSEGWRHPTLSLHSSNEPGELSQWLCHDDSTINIVIVIIIIIIIIIPYLLNQRNHTLKEWETGDTNITITLTVTPMLCHSFKQNYLLALPWLANGPQQISYNTSAQCHCRSNISRSTFTGRMLFLIPNSQLQSKAQSTKNEFQLMMLIMTISAS